MTEIETPEHTNDADDTPKEPATSRARGVGLGAIVAVALAVGFVVWLLAVRDDDSSTSKPTRTNGAAVSEQDLVQLARQLGHPIYWAGKRASNTYELTRTGDGSTFVRYLPPGVDVGDPRPNFTVVGTYPSATAYGTLETGAKRKNATVYRFPSGALAVSQATAPSSVFFAFPNTTYLVEVFDPSPEQAWELVKSGRLQPVR